MASASSKNYLVFEEEDFLFKNLSKFEEFRKRGLFCDVVIKAGDREFPANRNVLAATIPYFYTMFTSEYMESKQNEIVINGVDPVSLEALIEFSYSGRIVIHSHNVHKIMMVADYVQSSQVKNACAEFLTSKIEADTALEIKKFANFVNCKELVSAADEFINEYFPEISGSHDFLLLEFEEVKELIENDGITCSEEIVFEAAMKWVKHDEVERKSFLLEILSKVRFSHVSTEFLVNVVGKEELIWSSLEGLRIVDEAKSCHLIQWENKLIQNSRDLPKLSKLAPILQESQLKLYDITKNEWSNRVPLNGNRPGSAVVSLDRKLYVIGGSGNEKEVDIYELKTNKWSKGNIMITWRYGFGATTLNDCIYVCGGTTELYLSSVECYSSKENTWKSVAPMNENRYKPGVISLNGFIYAIAGYNKEKGKLNSCEIYDPILNTWTIINPLRRKKWGPSVATINNKIYACGGHDDFSYLNSCEVYDPSSDTWSMVAPMNLKRFNFSLNSINGKLYAVGGNFQRGDMPSVEVYSPETDSWKMLFNP